MKRGKQTYILRFFFFGALIIALVNLFYDLYKMGFDIPLDGSIIGRLFGQLFWIILIIILIKYYPLFDEKVKKPFSLVGLTKPVAKKIFLIAFIGWISFILAVISGIISGFFASKNVTASNFLSNSGAFLFLIFIALGIILVNISNFYFWYKTKSAFLKISLSVFMFWLVIAFIWFYSFSTIL